VPQGREWDIFVLPSGKPFSTNWLHFILRAVENIDRFRVIQERPDHVVVQVSFFALPSPELLTGIKDEIAEAFQEPMQIDIQITDFVPEPGVKFKPFVSKVGVGEFAAQEDGKRIMKISKKALFAHRHYPRRCYPQ
jgi:hypothetical protein